MFFHKPPHARLEATPMPTPNTFLKAEKKRRRVMTLISLPLGVYHTKKAKTITQGFMG